MTYPPSRLKQEAAFIAYHFHWPLGDILSLSHTERLGWVREINEINTRLKERVR
ncbi:hypothetical protein C9F11_43720 (plasmid) [Streptomyces sp. YIM 121038]|uniref:DUF6760 family protein n=1 Tax=Streptomyces sp. YIM 121038 TaxID=2136401 RepID=UPI0011623F79|nr:hypothetical protein C9F11_43720 [Streptomyces sp. YIM 121038]